MSTFSVNGASPNGSSTGSPSTSSVARKTHLATTEPRWVRNSLLALALAHAGAALWHHFFRRDHVLRSMLPLSMLESGTAANQYPSLPDASSG